MYTRERPSRTSVFSGVRARTMAEQLLMRRAGRRVRAEVAHRTQLLFVLLIAVPLLAQGSPPRHLPPPGTIRWQFNVAVPMRDGVRLRADVFLPANGTKSPVLLIRTPYGKNREQDDAVYFAPKGYAVVIVDSRGRNDSDGAWYPWVNEDRDGYDAIEWAAAQSWSNGRVVTYGGSYVGMDQWQAATQHPPHLAGMVTIVCPSDIYQGVFHPGGTFDYGTMLTWAFLNGTRTETFAHIPLINWSEIFNHLPQSESLAATGLDAAFYRDWIDHYARDRYWQAMSWRNVYKTLDVPVFIVAGWYDIFQDGSFENFQLLTTEGAARWKSAHRMLVGPWAHGGPVSKLGDVDFGPSAKVEVRDKISRWLDHYFLAQANGADKDQPIEFFLMGPNQWRQQSRWPPDGVRSTRFFLTSNGGANTSAGDGRLTTAPPSNDQPDHFDYDPMNPVPTLGGTTCCDPSLMPPGPKDQRSVEARKDVLVYTTEPLSSDMTLIGHIDVHLFAATSARDTDWTAKLMDVAPDGVALNLADGIVRARFSRSLEEPELLEPGTAHDFAIDLGNTAYALRKGHRIRLDISSSNFPRYSRNTNTAEVPEKEKNPVAAHQTVYHDHSRASYIDLPVSDRVVTAGTQ
jgi:uncharacterized protein